MKLGVINMVKCEKKYHILYPQGGLIKIDLIFYNCSSWSDLWLIGKLSLVQ